MVLPDGYTLLEYIESDGTQYIDTGVKPATGLTMALDAAMLGDFGSKNFIGIRNASGEATNRFGIVVYTSDQKWGGWYGISTVTGGTCSTDRHLFEIGPDGYYEDGTLVGAITENTFSCSYILPLMAWSNGSGGVVPTPTRLWGCKLYDGDTLIRNFLPVRSSDGTVGAFDSVTGTFYGNAGTGAFTAGPEVEINVEPPGKIEILGTTQTAVALGWAVANTEQGYRLYRDGSIVYEGAGTSFVDTGLAPATTHTYTIVGAIGAVESDGVTVSSTTKSAVELIVDRTAADVAAGRRKGRYNALDLIRVGEAIQYAVRRLNSDAGYNISASPKLDWQLSDIPTRVQMEAYLRDIATIRRTVAASRETPLVPGSMSGLTWALANDIEKILQDAETMIKYILLTAQRYSGRTISGGVPLP